MKCLDIIIIFIASLLVVVGLISYRQMCVYDFGFIQGYVGGDIITRIQLGMDREYHSLEELAPYQLRAYKYAFEYDNKLEDRFPVMANDCFFTNPNAAKSYNSSEEKRYDEKSLKYHADKCKSSMDKKYSRDMIVFLSKNYVDIDYTGIDVAYSKSSSKWRIIFFNSQSLQTVYIYDDGVVSSVTFVENRRTLLE